MGIRAIQKEVSQKLINANRISRDFADLRDWPLIAGKQCFYVMDWQKGKLTFSRGLHAMLGYDESNGEAYEGIHSFHPEDALILNRIIRGIAIHSAQNDISGMKEYLNVSYRLKKKNGEYLKVIRQSGTYEVDQFGRLISNWSFLTDISFISNNNKVEWDIYAGNLDLGAFRNNVFREFVDFFTQRELEIVNCIATGLTNVQIAKKLNISIHTVGTHRKNILRKSQCGNSSELLEFCYKNGIL